MPARSAGDNGPSLVMAFGAETRIFPLSAISSRATMITPESS